MCTRRVDGALSAGERQRRSPTGYKAAGKVGLASREIVIAPRAHRPRSTEDVLQRVPLPPGGWLVSCSVDPVVDRGGRHASALEPLPADRAVQTHDAFRTLTTIRLYPTRLETRTKESNMCASLRVIETCGHNESEGGF